MYPEFSWVKEGAILPRSPRRGTTIDEILLHESVAGTRDKTVRALTGRGLSVHFIVDRDGSVTQHVPVNMAAWHGGGAHNSRSIGIEVVNAYYGDSDPNDATPEIKGVWVDKGWYILPTEAQLESVWTLVWNLWSKYHEIPAKFTGRTSPLQFLWGRLPLFSRMKVKPGVSAHHHYDHADGLFVEHYCAMRAVGWSAKEAYEGTLTAAQNVGSDRLSKFEVKYATP